jgi:hypothetical protein
MATTCPWVRQRAGNSRRTTDNVPKPGSRCGLPPHVPRLAILLSSRPFPSPPAAEPHLPHRIRNSCLPRMAFPFPARRHKAGYEAAGDPTQVTAERDASGRK